MAMEVHFRLRNLQPSEAAIETIFRSFMATFITPERPFYYHTDEARLNRLFDDLAAAGVSPRPSVFPSTTPASLLWEEFVSRADYQGCGHLLLMLQSPANYSIASSFIPATLLKVHTLAYIERLPI